MTAAKTILLVEDDPASRRLVRAVLQNGHYRIRETEDLPGARAALSTQIPALVLLDLRLKGEEGLRLVREMRADPRLTRVPVVAITAQALKDDESRILAAGCNVYLAKPINTRQLREVVDNLLGEGAGDGE